MVCKKSGQKTERVEALRGGLGAIGKTLLFGEAALPHWLRLAGILELEPGCSIGQHDHTGETELFYILEGSLYGLDAGQEVLLEPGDATLTGGGQEHRLINRGTETARVLAIIVQDPPPGN